MFMSIESTFGVLADIGTYLAGIAAITLALSVLSKKNFVHVGGALLGLPCQFKNSYKF